MELGNEYSLSQDSSSFAFFHSHSPFKPSFYICKQTPVGFLIGSAYHISTQTLSEVISHQALADYISPFHDVDVIRRHSSAAHRQRFNSSCHPETLPTRRPVLEIKPVTCRTWWSANIGQSFLSQPQRKATLIGIQERDLLFRRIPSCCSAMVFRADFPI